jgi:hypothetical protein
LKRRRHCRKKSPKNKINTKILDERYGHQRPKIGYKNKQVPKRKRSESTTCTVKIMAPALFLWHVYCTRDIVSSQWGSHSTQESIEFATPCAPIIFWSPFVQHWTSFLFKCWSKRQQPQQHIARTATTLMAAQKKE